MAEEDKIIEIKESELAQKLTEERIKGSNMLYTELINYQYSMLEVFAAKFAPQNSTYEKFLAFVIFTFQKIYEDKYKENDNEDKQNEEKEREQSGNERREDGKEGQADESKGQEAS